MELMRRASFSWVILLITAVIGSGTPSALALNEAIGQGVFSLITDKKVYKTWEPVNIEVVYTNPEDSRVITATSIELSVIDLATKQVKSFEFTSFDSRLTANSQKTVATATIPANKLLGGGRKYKLIFRTYVTYVSSAPAPPNIGGPFGGRLDQEIEATTVIEVR